MEVYTHGFLSVSVLESVAISVNDPQEVEGARCQVSLLLNFNCDLFFVLYFVTFSNQNVFLCRVKFSDIYHHFHERT